MDRALSDTYHFCQPYISHSSHTANETWKYSLYDQEEEEIGLGIAS